MMTFPQSVPVSGGETPIHYLPRISSELGVQVLVKRDDLSPIPGGGNKYRKLMRILSALPSDTSVVVTNGDVNSNHCRVLALLAARRGLGCELVLHGQHRVSHAAPNLRLAELSGARIRVVDPSEIANEVSRIAAEREAHGEHVAVIPGGGHSPEGASAFMDAALSAQRSLLDQGIKIDKVVHASGTGTTQAGLAVGFASTGIPVWGVSVARRGERGMAPIREAASWLTAQIPELVFLDDWVGDGYGLTLPAANTTIVRLAEMEGLVLDPVYTGKAMTGLIDLVHFGRIAQRETVLFWHTGGLLNLIGAISQSGKGQ